MKTMLGTSEAIRHGFYSVWMKRKMAFRCTVESKPSIIYLEKLSLEVREVSKNVTKTLPNIANPHIGIYREIGQQVLASIEDGHTDRQTDRQTGVTKLYI